MDGSRKQRVNFCLKASFISHLLQLTAVRAAMSGTVRNAKVAGPNAGRRSFGRRAIKLRCQANYKPTEGFAASLIRKGLAAGLAGVSEAGRLDRNVPRFMQGMRACSLRICII